VTCATLKGAGGRPGSGGPAAARSAQRLGLHVFPSHRHLKTMPSNIPTSTWTRLLCCLHAAAATAVHSKRTPQPLQKCGWASQRATCAWAGVLCVCVRWLVQSPAQVRARIRRLHTLFGKWLVWLGWPDTAPTMQNLLGLAPACRLPLVSNRRTLGGV